MIDQILNYENKGYERFALEPRNADVKTAGYIMDSTTGALQPL